MVRLDRYILSQLMGPFGIFSLILIGVYWVNRAIGIFDQLIGDGHSIQTFVELIVIFLPQVVSIVLPVVSFAAAIYASNRLHSDSEFVVLMAAGLSPYRLIRPFFYFAFMVALLATLLSHYLVPLSRLSMDVRQQELSRDLGAKLIAAGEFLHPAKGITFYIREIQPSGGLFDVFLHDASAEDRTTTYTAQKALLLRDETTAKLVMFDGLIQTVEMPDRILSKVRFQDFTYDMGAYVNNDKGLRRSIQEYSTWEALFPSDEMIENTQFSRAKFVYEAHDRLLQPIHVLLFPLVGMVVLILGGFSRHGVGRQIAAAVGVIVVLNVINGPIKALVLSDITYWPMLYLPDFLGAVLVLVLLIAAARKQGRHTFISKLMPGGSS